jgi:hypothetical protein
LVFYQFFWGDWVKKIYVIFLAFLIFFSSVAFVPVKHKAYAMGEGSVARVLETSVGERVLDAVAEKAGVKFLSKSAREAAVKRWNMDLWQQVQTIDATGGDSTLLRNLSNYMKNLSDSNVVPNPNHAGFGTILVNTAMFLSGASIVRNSVKAIKAAGDAKTSLLLMDDMKASLASGDSYYAVGNITQWVSDTTLHVGNRSLVGLDSSLDPTFQWFKGSGALDMSKPLFATINSWSTDSATNTLILSISYLGTYLSGSSFYGTDTARMSPDAMGTDDSVQINHVPTPDQVPEVDLQPWTNEIPNIDTSTVGDTVPVEIPLTDTGVDMTNPLPWNDPSTTPDTLTNVNTDPGTGTDTGGTPQDTTPTDTNPMPWDLLTGLLDLLRAIIMYLLRMSVFVVSLPLITPIDINNPAFEWFKNAAIMGVHIYSVVSSMASIGFSFLVYKSIRKVLA